MKPEHGAISIGGSTLTGTPCSSGSRLEKGSGTDPEEPGTAAGAGCFWMACPSEPGKGSCDL